MAIDFHRIFSSLILLAVFLAILRLFLRRKIRTAKLRRWFRSISDRFHEHQFLKIPELNENLQENQLFRRISLYLNSLESIEDSDYTNLFSGLKSNEILLSINPNQTVVDEFLGARIIWSYDVVSDDEKSFILKIRKRDKRRILRPYLQHIHTVCEEIDQKNREIRLFTNEGENRKWKSVNFTHPATIETIAMDVELKNKIKSDLETFLKSKQYYHRLGRVWRRSYLLYGPSGTGKSSFVAAMAKTLSFDVYDLDLSKISNSSDLKLLLLQTSPRSLILIEDFDRHVSVTSPVNISGILNFMDGVVSACCDERVMVFTMTTKDQIDPTLLRPGRVDVHIHFPLCDFSNFKNLASSYLGVKEHKLFPQVEEILEGGGGAGPTMSPAEIGELMMANRSSPSRALKSVISALQTAKSSGVRMVEEEARGKEGGGGGKDLRKLVGLLRRKSLRKSGSFDIAT